jgi:hypothetical protein
MDEGGEKKGDLIWQENLIQYQNFTAVATESSKQKDRLLNI